MPSSSKSNQEVRCTGCVLISEVVGHILVARQLQEDLFSLQESFFFLQAFLKLGEKRSPFLRTPHTDVR